MEDASGLDCDALLHVCSMIFSSLRTYILHSLMPLLLEKAFEHLFRYGRLATSQHLHLASALAFLYMIPHRQAFSLSLRAVPFTRRKSILPSTSTSSTASWSYTSLGVSLS